MYSEIFQQKPWKYELSWAVIIELGQSWGQYINMNI